MINQIATVGRRVARNITALVVLACGPMVSAYAATLLVPENYPTIQRAINAASSGDLVEVDIGTYRENIVLRDGVQGEGEPSMSLGVLVAGKIGTGEFVVIGDDAIFQNKFLSDANLVLAQNISVWLKKGLSD